MAYCSTAYAAYRMQSTPGYFVHEWNMHNEDLIEPLYLILVYGCGYSATLALIKTAILINWCRLLVVAQHFKDRFVWLCGIVIVIQLIWGAACIILLNLQCVPHAAIWEFYLPSKCYSASNVMLASASIQVVSDWVIFGLPHMKIWKLHMTLRKKFGLALAFGVGGL